MKLTVAELIDKLMNIENQNALVYVTIRGEFHAVDDVDENKEGEEIYLIV